LRHPDHGRAPRFAATPQVKSAILIAKMWTI
jgi:hypothetical protein